MKEDKEIVGFWVYLMSDCVLFAGLFATYAVLQSETFGSASIAQIVSLPFVLTETLVLLASSFTVGLALLAARHRKKSLTLVALAVTLLLGIAFLVMEISEFSQLVVEGSGPDKSAFLSAFFVLLGTHGAHLFFGSLWMLVLMAQVVFKGLSTGVIRRLVALSLFWHFLDIIWIFIFTFVYLMGALN